MKEYRWYGWNLRKNVKWPIKELYEKKLKHRLSVWLKITKEELSEAEYGQ